MWPPLENEMRRPRVYTKRVTLKSLDKYLKLLAFFITIMSGSP